MRVAAAIALAGTAALLACSPTNLPAPTPETPSAWRLVNPRDFPVTITALWGVSPARMLAVGAHGAVLVKEGGTWRQVHRPTRADFFDLHGCDWHHVYAVAENGIYRFDGRTWSQVLAGSYGLWDRVWCRAPDDVMVITLTGMSDHFDGTSWRRQTVGMTGNHGSGHWLTGTADGYLAVGWNGTAVWRDGAWTYRDAEDSSGRFLDAVCWTVVGGVDRYLAVGSTDAVLVSTTGETWTRYAPIRYGGPHDIVSAPGDTNAYLLTERLEVASVISASGDTVAVLPDIGAGRLCAVAPGPGDVGPSIYLGGALGSIYGVDVAAGGPGQETGGVLGVPHELVVATGGDFYGIDGPKSIMAGRGGRVSRDTLPADVVLQGLAQAGPDLLVGISYPDRILRIVPGASCDDLAPVPGAGHAVWCAAPDDIWVGGSGFLVHGDGTSWQPAPVDSVDEIQRILGLEPDEVYIWEGEFVWEADRILHWDGNAITVVHEGSRAYSHSAAADPDGDGIWCVVAALEGGSVLNPILKHFGAAGVTSVASMPGSPGGLAFAGGGRLLVDTSNGLHVLEDGVWTKLSHPATDEGGYISQLVGDPTGGIYTVSDLGVIHYLDTGGTGLWQ